MKHAGCRKSSFARMHVFKYSRRKGTPAASYPDQVAPQKKEERSRILIELASRMTLGIQQKFHRQGFAGVV